MRYTEIMLSSIILFLIYQVFIKKSIKDITNQLPKHRHRTFPTRTLAQISQIVVHHSAGNVDDQVRDIAEYHIGPNHVCDQGCPGILYHFVIDRKGNAYQVNKLTSVSYHAAGHNTKSVGICFIGNYDEIRPTKKQIRAFRMIVRHINKKVGKELAITTHGKTCGTCTACPGTNLEAAI